MPRRIKRSEKVSMTSVELIFRLIRIAKHSRENSSFTFSVQYFSSQVYDLLKSHKTTYGLGILNTIVCTIRRWATDIHILAVCLIILAPPFARSTPPAILQHCCNPSIALVAILSGTQSDVSSQCSLIIGSCQFMHCINRCYLGAPHASRSDTICSATTWSTQARRRAGLRSFGCAAPRVPLRLTLGSTSQSSDQKWLCVTDSFQCQALAGTLPDRSSCSLNRTASPNI